MCWSLQASLVTWVIGLVAGIFLLQRKLKNDIVLGLLILTYSSMQLWEALMWYDQKCGKINLIATKLAYIALWSHVLAIGVGLYLEQKIILPLIVGASLLLFGLLSMPTFTCSLPGKNKHLNWGFNPAFYTIVFSISILFCLLYIKPVSYGIAVSLLFLLSFAFCFLYGYDEDPSKSVVGSFWCWICAFFSVIFILLPYYFTMCICF
jgi:hypothetical protein